MPAKTVSKTKSLLMYFSGSNKQKNSFFLLWRMMETSNICMELINKNTIWAIIASNTNKFNPSLSTRTTRRTTTTTNHYLESSFTQANYLDQKLFTEVCIWWFVCLFFHSQLETSKQKKSTRNTCDWPAREKEKGNKVIGSEKS